MQKLRDIHYKIFEARLISHEPSELFSTRGESKRTRFGGKITMLVTLLPQLENLVSVVTRSRLVSMITFVIHGAMVIHNRQMFGN